MSEQDVGVWTGIGTAVGAAILFLWMRLTKNNDERPGLHGPPRSPITRADEVQCYTAFVNGMEKRSLSFFALKAVLSTRIRQSKSEIGKGVSAAGFEEWHQDSLDKVLTDLRAGQFIRVTNNGFYEPGPNGELLLNDFESWRRDGVLVSSEDEQVQCLQTGIAAYVENANSFYPVLRVLDLANGTPLSAQQIFDRAVIICRKWHGKTITKNGVSNLLEALTFDPFVERQGDCYIINRNGMVLAHAVALRRPRG